MLLFAYGTLKRLHYNNHYLDNGEYIRDVWTEPRYRLFANDSFPMMIEAPEDGYQVCGELWDIPQEDVPAISRHEGSMYRLQEIDVRGFDGGIYAYVYQGDVWPNKSNHECFGSWP